jgi:hypothetical protein
MENQNAAGPHHPAPQKPAQVAYDKKVGDPQKSANCADDPFDVPILESDQSKAMKAIAVDFKVVLRLVTCCSCDNFKQESECELLVTTMDKPPPESWMAPLRETVNSIIIEGAPDPYSSVPSSRVNRHVSCIPELTGMSPAWKNILVSPRGFYEVLSAADTTVQDRFVYPLGSYADLHVDTQ